MDVYSRAKRSEIMAGIRATGTQPEIVVRRLLRRLGVHYRTNLRSLPGKPDIVLPDLRSAIFVNGCFWHHHPRCRKALLPTSNSAFWEAKIKANVLRDRKNAKDLRGRGWRVLIVWGCETKDRRLERKLKRFLGAIEKPLPRFERSGLPARGKRTQRRAET